MTSFLVLVLVFSSHKAVPGVVVLIVGVYHCLLASFKVREARICLILSIFCLRWFCFMILMLICCYNYLGIVKTLFGFE